MFSTNGTKADINRLVHLKQRYNAILIIDASHSLGLNLFECHADIDIVTSSLSKAWGAHGGLILSSKDIKDLILIKVVRLSTRVVYLAIICILFK